MKKTVGTKRPYTMTARAEQAERTRLRILDAAVQLGDRRLVSDISLEDIAEAAGVSVQTVLRKFGNRAALIDAAFRHAASQIIAERRAPVGDVDAAIRLIVDHYEKRGDGVLLRLAEDHEASAVRILNEGRTLHRDWVITTFGPFLPPSRGARDELVDLLAVASDVYTWKQLRRDRGYSRRQTERRMHRMITALLDGLGTGPTG